MKIFNGKNDIPSKPTKHTLAITSCGCSSKHSEDVLTIRENGRLDWSLYYCQCGRVTFDNTPVTAGQIWIYPPNTPHKYRLFASENTKYFYLHFSGADISCVLQELHISNGHSTLTKDMSKHFEKIMTVRKREDAISDLKCEYLLMNLLVAISENLADSALPYKYRTILHEMENSFSEKYDVQKYAKMLNLSASRFNHLFKAQIGCAPKEHIFRLRISYACELLTMTDLKIIDIATAVGYPDSFSFSKFFRNRTGFTPSQYRKIYYIS